MFYVTFEQFRDDIHEIVATHPDFMYPLDPNGDDADLWLGIGADEEHYATDSVGCRYSLRGSDKTLPACIIGHYLAKHGWLQHAVEGTAAAQVLKAVEKAESVIFATEASDAALVLQSYQDGGMTWDEAFHLTFEKENSNA